MKNQNSLVIVAVSLCSFVSLGQAEDAKVRGVVKALTEATIAIDYTARVMKLPVLEGEAFNTGDVLISFDCKKYTAEISAARASAHAAELIYSNNRKLAARGAMGSNEVEISQAQMAKAEAEAQALQARTGSCNFKAPFNGRMVQRIVQEQESPAPNQPLIRIVDTSKLEIETIIPSKWLNWVKPGITFKFTVDETGQALDAEVLRVGATVDAVSQTIKAYGVMKTKDPSVLPGMSGTAMFNSLGS
jgi:membrane fusion protein, multidrug efflux system